MSEGCPRCVRLWEGREERVAVLVGSWRALPYTKTPSLPRLAKAFYLELMLCEVLRCDLVENGSKIYEEFFFPNRLPVDEFFAPELVVSIPLALMFGETMILLHDVQLVFKWLRGTNFAFEMCIREPEEDLERLIRDVFNLQIDEVIEHGRAAAEGEGTAGIREDVV